MGLKISLGLEFFQNVAAFVTSADGDRRARLIMRTSETRAATLNTMVLGGMEPNMPALKVSIVPVMAL